MDEVLDVTGVLDDLMDGFGGGADEVDAFFVEEFEVDEEGGDGSVVFEGDDGLGEGEEFGRDGGEQGVSFEGVDGLVGGVGGVAGGLGSAFAGLGGFAWFARVFGFSAALWGLLLLFYYLDDFWLLGGGWFF